MLLNFSTLPIANQRNAITIHHFETISHDQVVQVHLHNLWVVHPPHQTQAALT